ncbi:hypothetical protein STVA_43550 [Allostella vacuolata]|nr:hypothetical protein STVA_43550 [Stella vacuolata]
MAATGAYPRPPAREGIAMQNGRHSETAAGRPADGAIRQPTPQPPPAVSLPEDSPDGLELLGSDGTVLYRNAAARERGQVEVPDQAPGAKWSASWHDGHLEAAILAIAEAAAGRPGHFIGSSLDRLGRTRWWDVVVAPVPASPGQLLAVSREVTRYKQAEEALAVALAHREVLFREISHRVVNGFQVVQGMIRLQRRRLDETNAQDVLQSAEQRVQAMALVHRRLYAADASGSVTASGYLAGLCDDLRVALIEGHTQQTLHCDIGSGFTMSGDRAILLGLLAAELVTNASKHAHPPDRPGTITLALQRAGRGYCLSVSDDGDGLPPAFEPAASTGLGMTIIRAQVQQLGGVLEVSRLDPGTRFAVMFPA